MSDFYAAVGQFFETAFHDFETTVYSLASVLVVIAWVGCTRFIVRYATGSNWRSTLPGRTIMFSKVGMWILLSYALTARWLEQWLPFAVLACIGLTTYAIIAFIQWRLDFTLKAVQEGKVTTDNPNYTPLRDWVHRTRARRAARREARSRK